MLERRRKRVRLEAAKEDGANDRHAERAAELLRGAEDAAGAAGDLVRNGRERDVDERDDQQREPHAGDDQPRHDGPGVGVVSDMARAEHDTNAPRAISTPPNASTSRPKRWASGTATGAKRRLPTLKASAVSPAAIGEKPIPSWIQIANTRKKPCSAAEKAICAIRPAENAGTRSSRVRSNGATCECWRRFSTTPSAISPTTPETRTSQTQTGQPRLRPSSSG